MTGLRPVVDIMLWRLRRLDQVTDGESSWRKFTTCRRALEKRRMSAAGRLWGPRAEAPRSTRSPWVPLGSATSRAESVKMPSTPYDAKGLLKSAIRDDNPVVFYEDKMMYKLKGPVPEEEYTIPLGVADIKRAGEDLTIVATSSMVQVALGAAKMLEEYDVSAEVVDPRTLWPLDEETLIASAKKTSRVMVIDEGYERYGAAAELVTVIQAGAFYDLEAPVKRMCAGCMC